MIVTGIALPSDQLHEKSSVPSIELVYLASRILRMYKAKKLITNLEPGWALALAKAAVELKLPFIAAIPHPGRDAGHTPEARILYYEMLARAAEVFQTGESYSPTSLLECHCWQIDQADIVLALWDYEFYGETYAAVKYAVKNGVRVSNHWQDWNSLYTLRKTTPIEVYQSSRKGAQVF